MFRFRRKKKGKVVDEKRIGEILKEELNGYIKREELQGYLEGIERDKEKKKLWDSLSVRKKLKLLRYSLVKKGEQYGKK